MTILHLEDNPRDAELACDLLTAEWPACTLNVVERRVDFVARLEDGGVDLVLSDFNLPGFNGLEALQLVRERWPDVPFVFLSGTLGEEAAIEAVRAGAADYVVKDRMQRLPMAVQHALRESSERRERRQTAAALAQEQYLLRLLMENVPDFVYFKDLSSAYLSVSGSLVRLHGTEPGDLRGKSDLDFFTPEHARRAYAAEQEIIRTGQPLVDQEERVELKAGGVRWVSSTKLPLRDASGTIIGTFGISRDITARKTAEDQIREQAEIINASPVAIVIVDLQNRITACNAAAADLYGTPRGQLVGQNANQIMSLEAIERLLASAPDPNHPGRWTAVLPILTPQGQERHAELHVSLVTDSLGQPRGRLCIAIDVTEKKRLEEQFLRAQRLESIGMLAAGIAHDLNNVLAPVLMGAPLLHASPLPAADLRVVEAIEASAARGAALVRQILAFAHGAGGEQVLIQAKHLLRDVLALVRQSFPKSIRIVEEVPNHLWTVLGNPTQMHQVILNLCVNARDAMPDGGVLQLSARNETLDVAGAERLPGGKPGAYLTLEVRDSGTGISPEIIDRIWEPFFTTKGLGKGTGLGLATVRGIVASHNGFVTLQSARGEGTTFRVYLPAAESGQASPTGAVTRATTVPRGGGELVLVVDDDREVRETLRAGLGRSGFRVLVAADGKEALAQYTQRQAEVALVITDVDMPEMSGPALAATLRQTNPAVRVLFMSGGSSAGDRSGAVPAGHTLLEKPFAPEVLLERVRSILAGT